MTSEPVEEAAAVTIPKQSYGESLISRINQGQKEGFGFSESPKITESLRIGQMESIKFGQDQKQKQKFAFGFPEPNKQPLKLAQPSGFKFAQREKQKFRNPFPTPNPSKLTIPSPFKFKQPQAFTFEYPKPKTQKNVFEFFFAEAEKEEKKRKKRQAKPDNYLGFVHVETIFGASKRSDIVRGIDKTKKLVKKDIAQTRKEQKYAMRFPRGIKTPTHFRIKIPKPKKTSNYFKI